ncbi:CocE/NonD family hydrolase [Mesorhizobium sp. M0514]|uniref:CocE/NonD family hydrolase n=1 Tax=Mesorhizobium sp. M0514 TaxID=2956955 RepID=UPI00333D5FB8
MGPSNRRILDRAGLPPTDWDRTMSHPPESSFWRDTECVTNEDKLYTPALWIDTWNDVQPGEAIDAFNFAKNHAANATAHDNQYMIMGPGTHCGIDRLTDNFRFGDLNLGDARFDLWDAILKWNNHW